MRFSPFVERIGGEGAQAWDLHIEASRAKASGRDVIVLSVGDPDLATPAPITAAAIRGLEDGDTHYADHTGRSALKAAIARDFAATSGLQVSADNVCVFAGAQNALFAASLCVATTGDEVIALEPMYVTYEATIRASGADLIRVTQPVATGFRPDPAAIAAGVTPRTRAIVITTPNNPTGVVMTADELAAIGEIAQQHDLWVVADEVYAKIIFDGGHISLASLPGMAERTVTISSLSKSHAMTGWRLGWAIAPEAMVAHMQNVTLCMLYGQPGFIQDAGVVALQTCGGAADDIRATFRHRRDLFVDLLAAVPGLQVLRPAAGMFAMIDVRATGLNGRAFARALYDTTGVATLDATAFGPSAAGFIRVSFVVGDDELREAADRIARFMADLDLPLGNPGAPSSPPHDGMAS